MPRPKKRSEDQGKLRPSEQANRRRSRQPPQRDHTEGGVPACSHSIFQACMGFRTGWILAKHNEIVSLEKSVHSLKSEHRAGTEEPQ